MKKNIEKMDGEVLPSMIKKKVFGLVLPVLLAASILLQSLVPALTLRAEEQGGESGRTVSPKYGAQIPAWALTSSQDYTFDFEESSAAFYAGHEALRLVSRTGFLVENGRLYCKEGGRFLLSGHGYLGDDYGIAGGSLGFELLQTGGEVVVTLRDIRESVARGDEGLRFTFSGGNVVCLDTATGTSVTADLTPYISGDSPTAYEFTDSVTEITLSAGGTVILRIAYDEGAYSVSNYESTLTFYDGAGKELAKAEKSLLQRAGYFTLLAEKLEGYFESLHFTRSEIDQSLPEGAAREINYGNWVATDDLGRTTVLQDTAGAPKEDKTVGLFYFLCWVGAGVHVQDNTKLYLELGADGLKSYLEERGGEAYWAEPYFGYYRNTDTWVYRKHAYMLEAAGVDFIFLDISNSEVFDAGHMALFDTWLQIRREGGSTPQICFLTGDNPDTFEDHIARLRRTVYSEKNWDTYKELFFYWDGKPLIFGNLEGVSAETRAYLEKNFTVRGCWAWQDKTGYWNWLDEMTQDEAGNWSLKKGTDWDGNFEQLAVVMGHHPSSSKGRSFVRGVQPNNGKNDFEFSSDTARYGLGFQSLIEHALEVSPRVVMITGWNEWIAGNGRNADYMANTPVNKVCYVDQFNPEFSRDGEPMKLRDGVGFGDNFYYQMVDFIRQYKGMDALETATGQTPVDITAGESAWQEVGPAFRDTVGDAEFRNSICYDAAFRYLNGTGRNDFDTAKVSQDTDSLYFMVSTVNDIVRADDAQWMNLYLDLDMNHETGWEGYDYVLNRSRTDSRISVERFDGTDWTSVKVGEADYTVSGNLLTVRVDKALLGLPTGTAVNFDFKWTDNSTETGNVMEFMDLGDAAPNDRFNFRYVGDFDVYRRDILKQKGGGFPVWLTVLIIETAAIAVAAAVTVLWKGKKKTAAALLALLTAVSILWNVRVPAARAEEGGGDAPGLVTKTLSFQSTAADAGSSLEDEFPYQFQVDKTSGGIAQINDDGDAEMTMYTQAYIPMDEAYRITQFAYTFQLDFRSTSQGNGAIFIRAADPQTYKLWNPIMNVAMTFNFYEWDWSAETGAGGRSETGGSGIKVYQTGGKIVVSLKLYEKNGMHVRGQSVEFPFPEGFREDGMNTYRFTDDGKSRVEISVNGTLLCTVEYGGEPAPYPDGDEEDSELLYYKEATIKDAEGKELLRVDNARICAEYSTLAIANRGENFVYFNNLSLTYEAEDLPETAPPATEAPAGSTGSGSQTGTEGDGQGTAGKTDSSGAQPSKKDDVPVPLITGICIAVNAVSIAVIVVTVVRRRKAGKTPQPQEQAPAQEQSE